MGHCEQKLVQQQNNILLEFAKCWVVIEINVSESMLAENFDFEGGLLIKFVFFSTYSAIMFDGPIKLYCIIFQLVINVICD